MSDNHEYLPHLIVNVILSVAFASSFIGAFFFTYGKEVEKSIIVNNVQYTVDELLGFPSALLSDDIKKKLITYLNDVKLSDMTVADKKVSDNNTQLLQKAGIILSILLVVSLVASFYISKKYNLNFPFILSQNLILLCGIGLVEFVFLKFIAGNYISANPNIVKKKILETIVK